MTAADLAASVGTTKAQILAYETGRHVPEPGRIRQLAAVLGVHPVDLAQTSLHNFTELAALRRACGLTANEVVTALRVTPRAYRRFEVQGIAPARRPGIVDDLAAVLAVSRSDVEMALRRSPQARTRLAEMSRLLAILQSTYVEQEYEQWRAPSGTDPQVAALASFLGRSPGSVARLLRLHFTQLRARYLRMSVNLTTSKLEIDAIRRSKAESWARKEAERYQRDSGRLASRLDIFFRQALPLEGWDALARVHAAKQWASARRLDLPPEDLAALPSRFLQWRRGILEADCECAITPDGMSHIRSYKEWYAALYPTVKPTESRPTVKDAVPRRRRGEAT